MKKIFVLSFMALIAFAVNAQGPYKVGDYYNDGTKEGIVFEVDSSGMHGKIVSLDFSEAKWATCQDRLCASSMLAGMSNMNKVKKEISWKNNYPAFAWCASLGDSWYLPAIDELLKIIENKDKISRELNKRDYCEILNAVHWSSTEYNASYAWWVDMSSGKTNYQMKNYYRCYYVRAVSAF